MPRKFIDVLHELMTSQLFIVAMALLLFLLLITLVDAGQGEAVMGDLWI
jgi:hypothetical protein